MATLRALETLVVVAETGSLTTAAKRLHLSQPALSHQLRVLEHEVGAAVVDRLPRGVRLTPVGAAMLESARSASLAAVRTVALGRAVASGREGTLRVACAESMTAGVLAPALTRWRLSHPHVRIELTEGFSADAMAAVVLSGQSDLAVGPAPSPVPLHTIVLLRESFVVVVAPDHHLAGRKCVALKDLATEPFVHLDAANGLSGWLDALAAAAGVVLDPVVRVRTTTTAAALAAAGLGVALVPESTMRGETGIALVLDPPVTRDVVAMRRSTDFLLAEAFCAEIGAASGPASPPDEPTG